METVANPDQSMFDQASAAVAPWLSAWSNYETQKTERQKIDLLSSYQSQQTQFGTVNYDQQMRNMLGFGGTRSGSGYGGGMGGASDGGLGVAVVGVLLVGGLFLLFKK